MSFVRSNSSDSSSSSVVTASARANDPSNLQYNDRQHYQIIFNNDSRFFDTSLHLVQSYRDMGYIQLETDKRKKRLFLSPSTNFKPPSKGLNSLLRTQQAGFSSNTNINGTMNRTSAKPPFQRNHDHSISHRSDPGHSKLASPTIKRENTLKTVPQPRQVMPMIHPMPSDDSSDDSDIIVTRL